MRKLFRIQNKRKHQAMDASELPESFAKTFNAVSSKCEDEVEKIDWNLNRKKILANIQEEADKQTRKVWSFHFNPGRLSAALSLIFIAAAAVILFRTDIMKTPDAEQAELQNVIKLLQDNNAKKETLEYLNESRMILSSIAYEEDTEVNKIIIEKSNDRIKDLLRRKKYLNDSLDQAEFAEAQPVCDQVELLLGELSLYGKHSEENLALVQEYVKSRNLILKINLIEKELFNSEV